MAGLGAGTAGSLLGALLHGFDGAPAACAVLLVSSVRWMLSEWKSLSIHPLFSPGCAAGAVLMTELLIRRVVSPSETLGLCICQSMLAGGGTWFFARAAELFVPDGWIRGSTAARWGGILLASCGLATLTGVQWWNISPGGAAAMFAVAVCAHRKHTAGGSVSGTVLGSVFALSAGNPGLYYLGIGGIGMIAGCFAPLGRMAMAMTLPLTAGICLIVCTEVTLLYYLRSGKLYILGGSFIALGGYILLLEWLLGVAFGIRFMGWSLYPLTVLVLLGGLLIYLAINRSARELIKRKLFF
jgi:stage II sporulation protein E